MKYQNVKMNIKNQNVPVIEANKRVIIRSRREDAVLSVEVENLDVFMTNEWERFRLMRLYQNAISEKTRRLAMRELRRKYGMRFSIREMHPRLFRLYFPIICAILLLIITVSQLLR